MSPIRNVYPYHRNTEYYAVSTNIWMYKKAFLRPKIEAQGMLPEFQAPKPAHDLQLAELQPDP